MKKVLILDFGGQYNLLVARRVRECGVYCELKSFRISMDEVRSFQPDALIFTGGPATVFEEGAPTVDAGLFSMGIPVLGICYGMQLMMHLLGGQCRKAITREYGKTELTVNTASPGVYTLTYTVTDKAGNTATATRQVSVYENSSGGSPVYLTFDDGPSDRVTPRVLDTLKEYNVHATFFIVNYGESGKALIRRMIDEGHTVAIHGYSHDYAAIYKSDEAFMQNIYRLRDRLRSDFGYEAAIIRFPGGSSNTVSRQYSVGIMSRLAQRVQAEGFTYFDWNVSSGDAAGPPASSGQIYNNVTSALRHDRSNVVLMHDAGAKGTTADALPDIIRYCLANGYSIQPITPATKPVHHGITN